ECARSARLRNQSVLSTQAPVHCPVCPSPIQGRRPRPEYGQIPRSGCSLTTLLHRPPPIQVGLRRVIPCHRPSDSPRLPARSSELLCGRTFASPPLSYLSRTRRGPVDPCLLRSP